MKSPVLVLAACFALGILLAKRGSAVATGAGTMVTLFLVAAATFCLAGLILLRRGHSLIPTLSVLAGFAFAGAAAGALFLVRFGPNHISRIEERGIVPARVLRLEGIIISLPQQETYSTQFELETTVVEQDGRRLPVSGKVQLRVESPRGPGDGQVAPVPPLRWGDSIRVSAGLRRPRVYRNPGGFDFRGWLESVQDIHWIGYVRGSKSAEKISGPAPSWLESRIVACRARGLEAIDRLFPPWASGERNGAVLKAVLFGDRSALDSETIEQFRKTGLYHLLVVAGLHVGLLALLVALLLRSFRLGETWRSCGVLAVIAVYALVVEQRAPTLRATIMIAAYLLGKMLYRERSLLNAVGLAALVLLFVRPAWLFESGFDLSFSAALIIAGLAVPILARTTEPYRIALVEVGDVDRDAALAPKLAQFRLTVRSLVAVLEDRCSLFCRHARLAMLSVVGPARLAVWAGEALLFSLILQTGLMLPMIMVFHRVSFAGIGLNALSVPLMVVLLAIAFPSVILVTVFPAVAPGPATVLDLLLRALFALTDLPHLPAWVSYRTPGPPIWVAAGFVVSLVVAAWALKSHTRIFAGAAASFAVFLALLCLHPFPPQLPTGELEVTVLDCGQGDAVFLVFPDRATALINSCGSRERPERGLGTGRWNAGEEIVSPYLWSRGIKTLNVFALTETPSGQEASIRDIARNFRIREFWIGAGTGSPQDYAIVEDVERAGSAFRELKAGDQPNVGSASFDVLWPPAQIREESSAAASDKDSLVLRVRCGNGSALLSGEMSGKVERALAVGGFSLRSRLLELPRHGSEAASDPVFLKAVSPEIAWTRGGRPNLPNPGVLGELTSLHARVFRTDRDGAIEMTQRGSELAVRTYGTSPAGWTTVTRAARSLAAPGSSVR